MRNAMQLKAIINNIAKEKGIRPQLVLQNYMLERFLERVSLSRYRDNFIIKGGFLIASIVGLDTRATMDMDATIKGRPVSQQTVQKMVEDIIAFELMMTSISNSRASEVSEMMMSTVDTVLHFLPIMVCNVVCRPCLS